MAACRWVADVSSLSFVCVMTDSANKQNKNEAVGQPFVDDAVDGRCRNMGLCLIALLRPNKSRVFACVPVCCQTQALDCVCLECFPFAPWLREMICFTEFGLHVFAHSLCRYVPVRLYVEQRHGIKFQKCSVFLRCS